MRRSILALALAGVSFGALAGPPGVSPRADTSAVNFPPELVAAASSSGYGTCPVPTLFCQFYHPGSTLTQFCMFGDCFEMSHTAEARVVAADEEGMFPTNWFAWTEGTLTGVGTPACIVSNSGNKTRIEVPQGFTRCGVDLTTTGGHLYHWHIASNPTTGCLAWGECRAY